MMIIFRIYQKKKKKSHGLNLHHYQALVSENQLNNNYKTI